MVNLREGIKIFQCTPKDESEIPRVWLSSGTVPAGEILPESAGYCDGAFVPKEPWRSPTAQESALLWTEEVPPYYAGIGIVRLPSEVLAPFAEQGISAIATQEELKAFGIRENCQEALAKIIDYFTPLCFSNSPPAINGIGGMPPGLTTSTIDRNRGCHNGLHTDNWDKLPLNRKHEATNRICVNLGMEDRYFLFINLPEMTLFEMLGGSEEGIKQNWMRSANEEFMRRYPEYPVVKLRIAPGEAYIAPTENMIHDGTTADKKHLDIKIMMRGYYRIPA